MHLPVLFWWRCEFACDAGQFFESNRGVSSTWTTFVPSIMGPDRWTPWQGDGRQQGSLVYPVGGVLLPKMFWHMWCLCGVAAPGGSRILNMCVDQNCLEFYDGVCLHLYASGSILKWNLIIFVFGITRSTINLSIVWPEVNLLVGFGWSKFMGRVTVV